MIAGLGFEQLWRGLAAHLWQTTLVLLALFLISRVLRNAPARLRNALWWIGFAKIFMPLALLSKAGDMIAQVASGPSAASLSLQKIVVMIAGGAHYIMAPGLLVVGSRPAGGARGNALFAVLTLAWAGAAVFMFARWALRTRANRSLPATRLARCEAPIRELVEKAARAGGIDTGNVLVSPGVGVPAVSGFFSPRIIIPEKAAMELEKEELRAVLLHEDAHRRRREPLRLAFQRLALSMFFFYPPLWILLRELNISAEIACDEAVLEAGTRPETYAAAIARMLGLGLEESLAVTVLGLGDSFPISARLERLCKSRRYIAMRRHRLALLAAVFVVVVLSFIPFAPLADSQPAPGAPPEPPEPPQEPGQIETPPVLDPESVVYPEYPEVARENGIEGDVILEVTVGKDGKVEDVRVREGVPECPELGLSAIEAVKKWTFAPALMNEDPVARAILIPLAFNLDDGKPVETTRPPRIIDVLCPLPEYPADALDAGVEGKVLLEVLVKEDGKVGKAAVVEGIAGHPQMDKAALEAVREWRFEPATADGLPVEMLVNIPVEFRLDSEKTGG